MLSFDRKRFVGEVKNEMGRPRSDVGGKGVFDDVVVVGGAAGCVVAARLSESTSRSVLLLEAGPDLPAAPPDELRDGWRITGSFDWGYASEPDERGGVENLRRGKLLGGTSWVTRFAARGSTADYDEWAALGNAGWGFEDVRWSGVLHQRCESIRRRAQSLHDWRREGRPGGEDQPVTRGTPGLISASDEVAATGRRAPVAAFVSAAQ